MHNAHVMFQQHTGKEIQAGLLEIKNMKKILEC